MILHIATRLSRRNWILVAIALPILVTAWWAFRPERLWINKQVNEPAPFASTLDPQPLYTGRFEGKAHPTRGRATLYKGPDAKYYLRLTDFSTSNGPDVHVLLARDTDRDLQQQIVTGNFDSVELGGLKGNQGDQNYDVPLTADLTKCSAVVIYCVRFHVIFGLARLEPF